MLKSHCETKTKYQAITMNNFAIVGSSSIYLSVIMMSLYTKATMNDASNIREAIMTKKMIHLTKLPALYFIASQREYMYRQARIV